MRALQHMPPGMRTGDHVCMSMDDLESEAVPEASFYCTLQPEVGWRDAALFGGAVSILGEIVSDYVFSSPCR